MKNIPEINHHIPTTKAYWCAKCEAHNPYDYSVSQSYSNSSGSRTIHETGKVKCKSCGALMFCPADTLPWMYGLTGVGILLVAAGVIIAVSRGGIDIEGSEVGPEVFCLAFGAFPLLIGGMMIYYSKKWFAWSSAQKRKTREQLESEAMNHPFQPTYENSNDFNHWASQFLTSDEVDQLHEKYGSGTVGEELEPEAK